MHWTRTVYGFVSFYTSHSFRYPDIVCPDVFLRVRCMYVVYSYVMRKPKNIICENVFAVGPTTHWLLFYVSCQYVSLLCATNGWITEKRKKKKAKFYVWSVVLSVLLFSVCVLWTLKKKYRIREKKKDFSDGCRIVACSIPRISSPIHHLSSIVYIFKTLQVSVKAKIPRARSFWSAAGGRSIPIMSPTNHRGLSFVWANN